MNRAFHGQNLLLRRLDPHVAKDRQVEALEAFAADDDPHLGLTDLTLGKPETANKREMDRRRRAAPAPWAVSQLSNTKGP